MKVGWVGLGKLGLPCALAMETLGHEIMGTDASEPLRAAIDVRHWPEAAAADSHEGAPMLRASAISIVGTIEEVVRWADVVFVAVQTPHRPELDGSTMLGVTTPPADFDYTHLTAALTEIARCVPAGEHRPVAIVSTVLPGTLARILPGIPHRDRLTVVYNPFFIAMGTVVRDFLNPEFVLLGIQDGGAPPEFLRTVDALALVERCHPPDSLTKIVSIASAELAKVAYNTFISTKIAFANHVAEIADATDANVDSVMDVLGAGTRRITSTAYLTAGLGDGGGCHPRDNLALSWLAGTIDESFDFAGEMMRAREAQTHRLAARIVGHVRRIGANRIIVLGTAYKANTALTAGSAALLLVDALRQQRIQPGAHDLAATGLRTWDPVVSGEAVPPEMFVPVPGGDTVYVLAVPQHDALRPDLTRIPTGSVVVDPWGAMDVTDCEGIDLDQPGRGGLRRGRT